MFSIKSILYLILQIICYLRYWGEFDNIPISEDGETIDEDFFIWGKGHDKIDIWQWFDKHHSKGLAKGLMGLD